MDTGQVYIEWREGGELFCTKHRVVTIWSQNSNLSIFSKKIFIRMCINVSFLFRYHISNLEWWGSTPELILLMYGAGAWWSITEKKTLLIYYLNIPLYFIFMPV